jgi:hypothetical protein
MPTADRTPVGRGRWTNTEVLAALCAFEHTNGRPPTQSDLDPARAARAGQQWRVEAFRGGRWPSLRVVRRRFGTLNAALVAAGITPAFASPSRPGVHVGSDDAVLAAVRRWTARYGEPPTNADRDPSRARGLGQHWRAVRFGADDWPTLTTVRSRFGTMTAAVAAAGLEPGRRSERVAEVVARRYAMLRPSPRPHVTPAARRECAPSRRGTPCRRCRDAPRAPHRARSIGAAHRRLRRPCMSSYLRPLIILDDLANVDALLERAYEIGGARASCGAVRFCLRDPALGGWCVGGLPVATDLGAERPATLAAELLREAASRFPARAGVTTRLFAPGIDPRSALAELVASERRDVIIVAASVRRVPGRRLRRWLATRAPVPVVRFITPLREDDRPGARTAQATAVGSW